MTALKKDNGPGDLPLEAPKFDSDLTTLLNVIRMASLGCRVKRRSDLFRACALLSMEQKTSFDAHVEALVRGLQQAIGRSPVFYRPGTADLSFDESWLMRLADTAKSGDLASFEFLLRARVVPHQQRHLRFLVQRMLELFAP